MIEKVPSSVPPASSASSTQEERSTRRRSMDLDSAQGRSTRRNGLQAPGCASRTWPPRSKGEGEQGRGGLQEGEPRPKTQYRSASTPAAPPPTSPDLHLDCSTSCRPLPLRPRLLCPLTAPPPFAPRRRHLRRSAAKRPRSPSLRPVRRRAWSGCPSSSISLSLSLSLSVSSL
jgi:hypothetical protein